jgi:hypothetical protein
MLTDYTTYDDIRAALGVSTDELVDTTLALTLYADYLTGELEDINVTLPATFVSIKAIPSPTDVQTRFLQAARLFATFAVAKQLTAALPLFAAKQVGDGKATVARFDNPYKDTIMSVNEQYGKMRNRLVTALAAVGTASADKVVSVYLGVASPSVDPVTGT